MKKLFFLFALIVSMFHAPAQSNGSFFVYKLYAILNYTPGMVFTGATDNSVLPRSYNDLRYSNADNQGRKLPVTVYVSTVTPNSNVTAIRGSLCISYADTAIWIKLTPTTNAASNTGWYSSRKAVGQ